MNNYKLKTAKDKEEGQSLFGAMLKMFSLMAEEKKNLSIAIVAIIINSGMTLVGPLLVGYTIDTYVIAKNYHGVLVYAGILLAVYLTAFVANYIQVRVMGIVGQRTLWRLRNSVFTKLEELPVAFFNQNKAGDLISRINNDTNRLNQFFSQTLMQFTGNAVTIIGAGIFIVAINWKLGLLALVPALGLLILTQLISGWVKQKNVESLRAEGGLSAEVQESLDNFKVIVAFNRRDYFREKFRAANQDNFMTSVIAGLGNNFFGPVFDFAGNLAQLIILSFGIYLILHGQLEVGLLISYILYVGRFYDPLRQFAGFWATLQVSLAGWERISEIISLKSNLDVVESEKSVSGDSIMRFENVTFRYPDTEDAKGREVLHSISFNLDKGKTYALVGPTGGGKTTTASLIARLFDPTEGTIYLDGCDIRSYDQKERTKKIGFILQEPFLFSGSVKDNILYGNPEYAGLTTDEFRAVLEKQGFEALLERFESGLDTAVSSSGDTMSLGQRQLIAFMRAVLRNPELLILDEATANIDTVTEQLLEAVLAKLPKETTKVIIAHRLNTIESADEIFFVNGGTITAAGSMDHAVDMLLHNKRES